MADRSSLSKSDRTVEYYSFDLREYASLQINLTVSHSLKIGLFDDVGSKYFDSEIDQSVPSNNPILINNLLPRKYFLRFDYVSENSDYKFKIDRKLVPNSGKSRPDTAFLADAAGIGAEATVYDGFVGIGDRARVYPVYNRSSIANSGLSVLVTQTTGPVTIRYLNARQEQIAIAQVTAGKETELLAPFQPNERGFVQITADANSSTLYHIAVKAKPLYDPVFSTSFNQATQTASPKASYIGYVTPSSPRLILPIELSEAKKIRVELSDLEADVDLDLRDGNGNSQVSDRNQTGTHARFLEKDLQAGSYFIVVTLKDNDKPSKFQLYFDLSEQSNAVPHLDPSQARAKALRLHTPDEQGEYLSLMNNGEVQYFAFSLGSSEKMQMSATIGGFRADGDLDLYLEDTDGSVLAKSTNSGTVDDEISYILEVLTLVLIGYIISGCKPRAPALIPITTWLSPGRLSFPTRVFQSSAPKLRTKVVGIFIRTWISAICLPG